MKFISVSLVKDEADIIELFIRINSRVIDHFYIIDNGSTDATPIILNKMKEEGFNITVYNDPNPVFNQSLMISRGLRTASNSTDYDWVFILDADEFINIEKEDLEKELSTIPRNHCAALEWSTWIPKGDIYYDYNNPLWSCFNRKKRETENYVKVIIAKQFADRVVVTSGNHGAFINLRGSYDLHDGAIMPSHTLTCGVLDHVPVRSSSQIKMKLLIGSIKLNLKKDRLKYEGYHWDNGSDLIKRFNFEIDDLLLRYLSIRYSARDSDTIEDEVDEDAKFGLETDIIKYTKYTKIEEMRRIYNLSIELAKQLKSL
ncbi:Glycosyl transferase family 2 [uncultured Caudovirales phage]|uniref:Glycosyl transferase family 2 n=1 Tax=uncultured Caudovirales phage TaxID=2100421 RepID=A0A6J5KPM4_9CAUD|nr:Glycosyl transferase family 2 [uncultured Caudovirales phage]